MKGLLFGIAVVVCCASSQIVTAEACTAGFERSAFSSDSGVPGLYQPPGTCLVAGVINLTALSTSLDAHFSWDFGDGSPEAYGRAITHRFNIGSFVVNLRVRDAYGTASSAMSVQSVCGEGPPPWIQIYPVSGATQNPANRDGNVGAYVTLRGQPVTFSVTPPIGPYSWRFDDELAEQQTDTPSISHAFQSFGLHTVYVRSLAECWGAQNSLTMQVQGFLPGGPDALVILGAGRAGAASTEITLANPTGVEQFGTLATVPTPDQISGCPGACIYFPYHLRPNGTTTVRLAPGNGTPEFVGTYYVVPDAEGTPPVVAARAVREGSAVEAALPVFHLSTLLEDFVPTPGIDAGPTVLLGARKSSSTRSDLLLTVLQPPGTVDFSGAIAHVDVLDGSGATLAGGDFHLAFGESRVIPDIVGLLGASSLDIGQVRVTQTGGTNLLRSVLAATLDSGAVTVSAGDLPSRGPIPDPFFDAAIIAGGGAAGPWDTQMVLGDTSHVATSVSISRGGVPRPSDPSCSVELGDSATVIELASDATGCLDPAPGNIFLTRSVLGPPSVVARIFDRDHPSRSADIPVVTLSSIGDADALIFPFTREDSLSLYLTNPGRGAVSLHLELRSSDGDLLGTRDLDISAGDHVLLSGSPAIGTGQIRVTRTAGSGILRGLLAVGHDDGGFTITAGVNP